MCACTKRGLISGAYLKLSSCNSLGKELLKKKKKSLDKLIIQLEIKYFNLLTLEDFECDILIQ